jgi:hypothetical protein
VDLDELGYIQNCRSHNRRDVSPHTAKKDEARCKRIKAFVLWLSNLKDISSRQVHAYVAFSSNTFSLVQVPTYRHSFRRERLTDVVIGALVIANFLLYAFPGTVKGNKEQDKQPDEEERQKSKQDQLQVGQTPGFSPLLRLLSSLQVGSWMGQQHSLEVCACRHSLWCTYCLAFPLLDPHLVQIIQDRSYQLEMFSIVYWELLASIETRKANKPDLHSSLL